MTSLRIDPPTCLRGESRCVHDQLVFRARSTCSICLGLPDVPIDFGLVDEPERDVTPAIRWVHPENRLQCAECQTWIGVDGLGTWTAQGFVCRSCGESEAA